MGFPDFEYEIVCRNCGSIDIHICKHLDFTGGLNDAQDYTGDIVFVCQECKNKKLMKLKYEILY